jgi:hypothetical protein
MTNDAIKPWLEVVSLHPDVISDDFSEDIFALDLGPLAEGRSTVPAAYRDPQNFFRTSYITRGLRSLLEDVLSRLSGGKGNRVLKLLTPFGGGKSHTLAGIYHASQNRSALNVIPEGQKLPDCAKSRVAVFDGQFFDATNGKLIPGENFRARTMWGWIAWSLGGKEGYEHLREQDEKRVAPGGDEILELLKEGPNVILLDEVLNYLISAGGIKVEQTTLRDETLTFLLRLTVSVGNTTNTALVFSLQSSKRESLEYINLLQTIDHLAARKDQRREPVEMDEILHVIQRRLLAKIPSEKDATPVASTYQDIITQMKRAYARTPAEIQQADEEGIALRDRVRAAYPFHPALIDVMRERWAAIPDFQRTRGALRFLAACLRATHREGKSRSLLGPGDVPLHDSEVRLAFFKEVGQKEDFQPVLEHDLMGANARVRRIDERRARENPSETGKRPATRLATAILMYSFGGLKREGGKEDELLPPGVTEAELLSACVGPDLDSTTTFACLKELKDQCLYLHFDGVRYCFKKDPNVTLLVEQEADIVGRNEERITERIKEMLEERLAGHRTAIIWPKNSSSIANQDPSFLIAYLPLEFADKSKKGKEDEAKNLLGMYGDKPRKYRNGLALAIPDRDEVGILRRATRYLMAIEQVKNRSREYNLTDEQKSHLKEKEGTEKAAVESAFLKLYSEIWLPKIENGQIEIEVVSPGGRPLQTTLNEKKLAMIHERIIELLTIIQPKVFDTLNPGKIVSLFKLGEGEPPIVGKRSIELIDGFFSYPGFPRLTSSKIVQKAIARGIQEGKFGYYTGSPPNIDKNGKYEVSGSKVVYEAVVAEDEIDLDMGFIIMPDAIPAAEAPRPPGPEPEPPGPQPPEPPGPKPPGPSDVQRTVNFSFNADRDQLFNAWPAVANLADMAGTVTVSINAESEEGFDKNKLRNAVIEPLQEADLIE